MSAPTQQQAMSVTIITAIISRRTWVACSLLSAKSAVSRAASNFSLGQYLPWLRSA